MDASNGTTWNENDISMPNSMIHGLQIYNDSTTTNTFSPIHFRMGDSSAAYAAIAGIRTAADTGELAFVTRGSSGVDERLRIQSDGSIVYKGDGVGIAGTRALRFTSVAGNGSAFYVGGFAANVLVFNATDGKSCNFSCTTEGCTLNSGDGSYCSTGNFYISCKYASGAVRCYNFFSETKAIRVLAHTVL